MFFADLDLDVLTLESNDLSVIMWSARSIDHPLSVNFLTCDRFTITDSKHTKLD